MEIAKRFICVVSLVFFFCSEAFSYEVKTHEEITQYSFEKAFQKKNFLEDLGYKKITDEIEVKDAYCDREDELDECSDVSKTILAWVMLGSKKEDAWISEKMLRFQNHFYDPVVERGLDTYIIINDDPTPVPVRGEKATDWALESGKTYGSTQKYSIEDAKDYYKIGLTAKIKDKRDTYLAKMFRTLGHVVHLVQDMAQPQHTRNDIHGGILGMLGEKSQYEKQIDRKRKALDYTSPYSNGVSFGNYSHFFDTDDGRGLAEFSNSNFVTVGTNFWDCSLNSDDPDIPDSCTGSHYLEPKLGLSNKTIVRFVNLTAVDPALDPTGQANVTFFKNTFKDNYSGEKITNEKMTTYSIFDKDLEERMKSPAFTLNRFNYDEAAKLLIPRAVGYSAGLLNHFFRGEIDMKKDKNDASKYVIENYSKDEIKGTCNLYYDDTNGERHVVKKEGTDKPLDLPCSAPAASGEDSPGKSSPVTFTTPTDPAPIEKDKYTLVFKGTLGNESDAIVGKVVKLGESHWEDWNGQYNLLYGDDYLGGTYRYERFTIDTEKHTWQGLWGSFKAQDYGIRLENGTLKIDGNSPGAWQGGSSGWFDLNLNDDTDSNRSIPLKGCKLKMNIPYASITNDDPINDQDTVMYFMLTARNSISGKRTWIMYHFTENSFAVYDVPYMHPPTLLGTGEVERSLEDDFRSTVALAAEPSRPGSGKYSGDYIGDIDDWRIIKAKIYYRLEKYYYAKSASLAIDYIDFVCDE